MVEFLFRKLLFTTIFSLAFFSLTAQQVKEPAITDSDWIKSYQPFRIAGNLYYVGTYELACYLIVTNKGNILINTGTASSSSQLKNNIEALGFNFFDTKILLTTQVHFDHVGAMAAIKSLTHAQLMVDEGDAAVMNDGGNSDYEFGGKGCLFQPVRVDRLLYDNDTIQLGNMNIVMLHHPGHTKGSCSFLFTVKDDQRSYKVLIANMPSIVTEKKLNDVPTYPNIEKDYAYTFNAMKNISFDIWLASHASQFKLHEKRHPNDEYNPTAFMDPQGYLEELNALQKEFDERK